MTISNSRLYLVNSKFQTVILAENVWQAYHVAHDAAGKEFLPEEFSLKRINKACKISEIKSALDPPSNWKDSYYPWLYNKRMSIKEILLGKSQPKINLIVDDDDDDADIKLTPELKSKIIELIENANSI